MSDAAGLTGQEPAAVLLPDISGAIIVERGESSFEV
jgi:hypothetical protein